MKCGNFFCRKTMTKSASKNDVEPNISTETVSPSYFEIYFFLDFKFLYAKRVGWGKTFRFINLQISFFFSSNFAGIRFLFKRLFQADLKKTFFFSGKNKERQIRQSVHKSKMQGKYEQQQAATAPCASAPVKQRPNELGPGRNRPLCERATSHQEALRRFEGGTLEAHRAAMMLHEVLDTKSDTCLS